MLEPLLHDWVSGSNPFNCKTTMELPGFSARGAQIGLFELVAEQDPAIVGGTMQDMDDDHLLRFNAEEDQVVTMNSPTDTMVLEAGDEGEAVWSIEETLALAP